MKRNKTLVLSICIVLSILSVCSLCSGCILMNYGKNTKNTKNNEPYVSQEAKLYNKAVDDFFAALDNRDKGAIREMFSAKIQKKEKKLDEAIEKLFAAYPGPTDICKRDGRMVQGDYGDEHGLESAEISQGFPVVSNGTIYWCFFSLVYQNDEDRDEVGVKQVILDSAEYNCQQRLEPENRSGMMDKGKGVDKSAIQVHTKCSVDYEVRFVGGYPEKFEPIDRELTQRQVTEFFRGSYSYSKFVKEFGFPNVSGVSGWCAYELPEEGGEPRYLSLLFDEETDEILSAYIKNDLDEAGISRLWEKK